MSRDIPRPPSLPNARATARETLAHYERINVRDTRKVIEAYSALRTALGTLLDALDYQEASS